VAAQDRQRADAAHAAARAALAALNHDFDRELTAAHELIDLALAGTAHTTTTPPDTTTGNGTEGQGSLPAAPPTALVERSRGCQARVIELQQRARAAAADADCAARALLEAQAAEEETYAHQASLSRYMHMQTGSIPFQLVAALSLTHRCNPPSSHFAGNFSY